MTTPRLFSSVCIVSLQLCFFPETCVGAHPGRLPLSAFVCPQSPVEEISDSVSVSVQKTTSVQVLADVKGEEESVGRSKDASAQVESGERGCDVIGLGFDVDA